VKKSDEGVADVGGDDCTVGAESAREMIRFLGSGASPVLRLSLLGFSAWEDEEEEEEEEEEGDVSDEADGLKKFEMVLKNEEEEEEEAWDLAGGEVARVLPFPFTKPSETGSATADGAEEAEEDAGEEEEEASEPDSKEEEDAEPVWECRGWEEEEEEEEEEAAEEEGEETAGEEEEEAAEAEKGAGVDADADVDDHVGGEEVGRVWTGGRGMSSGGNGSRNARLLVFLGSSI